MKEKNIFIEYSDYFKKKYIFEILVGENNIKESFSDYENYCKNNQSSRIKDKILNLKKAVDFIFPDILNHSAEVFDENLAIKLNTFIKNNLFNSPGKYRNKHAKPSLMNYFYLEPAKIESELKKLFNLTRKLYKSHINDTEFLIKLGTQFFIHFLSIHPFENGNGRVARILLSYLLLKVTIVPLSIYNENNSREVYLECLKDERLRSPSSESNLASLILESAYFCLERVCNDFDVYPNFFV
jgi:Fic family protein